MYARRLFLILLVFCIGVKEGITTSPVRELHFTQPLSHFSPDSNETFQEFYEVFDKYFQPGGPIIFYVGAEVPFSGYEVLGSPLEFARALNGCAVAAEHRYFGSSLPFGNQSYSVANMVYLTIENALADYATIILSLKQNKTFSNSKVYTVGGSYGGYLSAMMRIAYPDLVDGAVADSPALYLYDSGAPTSVYFDMVSEIYTQNDSVCAKYITAAFEDLKQNFAAGNTSYIASALRLCREPSRPADDILLATMLKQAFGLCAEFNSPFAGTYSVHSYPLSQACLGLHESAGQLWGLQQAMQEIYNISRNLTCFDFGGNRNAQSEAQQMTPENAFLGRSPTSLGALRALPAIAGITERPWGYLCCTEIFLTSGYGTGIFVYPAQYDWDMVLQNCQDSYPGAPVRPVTSPLLFNDTTPSFSNVLIMNGFFDPTRAYTPSHNLSDSVLVYEIPQGWHCADETNPFQPGVPQDILDALNYVNAVLTSWL